MEEELVSEPVKKTGDRPDPEWVKGVCPLCGDDVVHNLYWIGGKGYLNRAECWSSLGSEPKCNYYKVL